MEWVSIKPSYLDGKMQPTAAQTVFTLLTKAGFQLEHMRNGASAAVTECFYFHPGLHIQVHQVEERESGFSRFFIFYPGGSTALASGMEELQQYFAAG